jgi:hypothetical protein
MPEAIAAAERSVAHSRKALEQDGSDPEVLAMLVNGLIAAALMDPPPRQEVITEFMAVRRKAVALGPENPRVAIMDAGIIFNAPPEFGGDKDKGGESVAIADGAQGAKRRAPHRDRSGGQPRGCRGVRRTRVRGDADANHT